MDDAGSFDCTWADNFDDQDVSVDVSDNDGGTDSDAISVDIANVKPSVSLSGDDSAFEGQTKTYNFSITDPGAADTHTITALCGMAGTISDYDYDPLTRTGSFDCTFPDGPALSNVTVTAFDDDGAADTDNQLVQVTVHNVAPVITAPSNQTADEGENHTFDLGSFSDPGTDTPWQVVIDWGDSSSRHLVQPGRPGAITDTAHTYADNGTYTVTITVTEEAGSGPGSDSKTFSVTVANVDPVVTLLGANSTTEGASEHYTFSITDAGTADTFTVDAYDCGANGVLTNFDFLDDAGSFDCTWADNFDDQDVSVDVSDNDGGTDSDAISVDIANVKPSVSLSGDDSAFEGQTKTYNFSITDPGAADTHTITALCGMAGTISDYDYDPLTRTGSFDCTFPDGPALSNVTVTAFDDDGAADTDNQLVQVTVHNVAPVITAPSNQTADEGENHTFDLGSFSDPGTDTPWQVVIDWGDSSSDTFNQAAPVPSPTPPTPTLTTAPTRSPSPSPRRPAAGRAATARRSR